MLDGVQALLASGDWLIATIIVAFSIVFPLLKIGALALLWAWLRRGAPPQRHLAGEAAALSRLLPIRSQRTPPRQSLAGLPHRCSGDMIRPITSDPGKNHNRLVTLVHRSSQAAL
jgi:hypothetical protein